MKDNTIIGIIAVATIAGICYCMPYVKQESKRNNESSDSTRIYKHLYLECNTKIKNDSTHKDCFKTKP